MDTTVNISALRGWLKAKGMTLALKALQFAEEKHNGQYRDGGLPYIEHPAGVALTLIAWEYNDEVTIIDAILHDVPEDCSVTIDEIEKRFGTEVSIDVKFLTQLDGVTQKQYLDDLFQNTKRGSLVKVADKINNMRSLKHAVPDRIERTINKTKKHFMPFLSDCLKKYQDDGEFISFAIKEIEYRFEELDQSKES